MSVRARWWGLLALWAVAVAIVSGACAAPEVESTSPATATTTVARYVDGIFRTDEGRFSVALPSEPTRTERRHSVDGADLRVVVFDAAVSDAEAYQVSYVDYPESLGPLDPEATLAGGVAGATRGVSGALESSTDVTFKGRPAVDAVITAAFPVRTRLVLAGRRLYTLQQVGPAEATDTYRRMLESFSPA